MRVDESSGYHSHLSRHVPTGRDLVPVRSTMELLEAFDKRGQGRPAPVEQSASSDARNLTPRQMVDMSMDLYVSGALSWDEYALLAFQPELHPDYDRTVGALVGRKAEPDRPRDFVAEWEDRLAFEEKYNADDGPRIESLSHIVTVLRQVEAPTDVVA